MVFVWFGRAPEQKASSGPTEMSRPARPPESGSSTLVEGTDGPFRCCTIRNWGDTRVRPLARCVSHTRVLRCRRRFMAVGCGSWVLTGPVVGSSLLGMTTPPQPQRASFPA